MYSIFDYGTMIADRVRMEAYVRALRQSVKPGSVVLDIGTGTGIFALLACQLGARRVYALEPSNAIEVAREVAAANDYSGRIEFIQKLSTEITLPERADVIVSDVGGLLPWFQTHIPSIMDARERLLAPGGVLIPQRDTVWAAVVQAPELYGRFTDVWDDDRFGFDMEAARRIVINTWRKARLTPEHLLVEPRCWATLDYATVASPAIRAKVSWTAAREGTAHGLGVWFDRTVAEGVDVSGAPGTPEQDSPVIYGHVFFPWFKPVALAPGDTVSVSLKADLVGEDYLWSWNTCVLSQGDSRQIKADFKQSSFFGEPLSPAQLRKQAASHVPALNENGQIDSYILESMDGCRSSDEIARSVSARYPSRFAKWSEALTRVGELAKKYSR